MGPLARSLALAVALLALGTALGGGPASQIAAASAQLSDDAEDADEAGPWQAQGRSFSARISAYAHGTRTASGTPVRWGVVAVDPRVIPFGSRLMIEGFDTVFVAEDTGGAVRGNHIDVYFPDRADAVRFGVQTRTVTVLS
jgi:3D (Asp-Asp-Asp) domain-containing protein